MFVDEDEKKLPYENNHKVLKWVQVTDQRIKKKKLHLTAPQWYWIIKGHKCIILTFDWGVSEPEKSIRAWSLMYAGA